MTHSTTSWRAACLALTVSTTLLSACGGGGSNRASDGAPIADVGRIDEFLVDNFVTHLAVKGGSFSASRTDSAGHQYTLKVVYAPGAAGSFLRQETLVTDGVSAPSTTTSVNYSHAGAAFRVIGWTDDKGNTASNIQSTPLPQVGKPGTGANMFTADLLIQNNGINAVDIGLTHKLNYDWSVANPNGASADVCLSLTEAADFTTQAKIDCFQIDGTITGTVYAFKSTLRVHAKSIDRSTVYQ